MLSTLEWQGVSHGSFKVLLVIGLGSYTFCVHMLAKDVKLALKRTVDFFSWCRPVQSTAIVLDEFAVVAVGGCRDGTRLSGFVPIDLCTDSFYAYGSIAHTGPRREDGLQSSVRGV